MNEIFRLSKLYGTPHVFDVALAAKALFAPINHRKAEVLPVILSKNKILVHTKSMYPKNCWRLPTGGLKERNIENAVIREVYEETSMKAKIRKFLAIINYKIITKRSSRNFKTYIFLVYATGKPEVRDRREKITGLRCVSVHELENIANNLKTVDGKPLRWVPHWKDWGEFRAVAHEVVLNFLKTEYTNKQSI